MLLGIFFIKKFNYFFYVNINLAYIQILRDKKFWKFPEFFILY